MPNLPAIARTLQTLFTDEAIVLARTTGLVRRQSKLTGPLILLILVAGFIQHPTASYNILAQVAADYGVPVTRQAVQQRLRPAAVAFFQHLLEHSLQLLETHCRLPLPLLRQFPAVYLLDSSHVALPPSLAAFRLRGAHPLTTTDHAPGLFHLSVESALRGVYPERPAL